ncbi:MAG: hypothetical protein DUD27_04270 [Lachnospiraceae bacterium]|uniref:Uncharacterized protein n=1 Tax=Candidatus Weimeria bifida TaxID=2599074 RepID=A0A6N7J2F6_9FIRM|nr:hypothetical protein [Candidatus Weimeria bifida]RRF96560.1 MAG: hypothetical protein DUD27_04270 [Lachnospiraceae bacterium]
MGLSIGRVGRISGSRNYAFKVGSTSEVSKAYTERISGIDAATDVAPADPVKYATAARGQVQADKEAEAGYNDLAETFKTGGYDSAGSAYSYSVVGRNYDEFV